MLFQHAVNIKMVNKIPIFCTDSENVYTDSSVQTSSAQQPHVVGGDHMDNTWSAMFPL